MYSVKPVGAQQPAPAPFVTAAPGPSPLSQVNAFNVNNVLEQYGDYSTLLSLMQTYNSTAAFDESPNSLTLFAPTNQAFEALDPSVLTTLQNENQVSKVLEYHVGLGFLNYSTLQTGPTITTVSGASYTARLVDGRVNIGPYSNISMNANITSPDVYNGNGRSIQGIDNILLPPGILTAGPASSPSPVSSPLAPASPTFGPSIAPGIGLVGAPPTVVNVPPASPSTNSARNSETGTFLVVSTLAAGVALLLSN